MQASFTQLVLFIIIPTILIFILAGLIISLLYIYQKRNLAFQKNINELKLDYEKNILKTHVEIQEHTFQNISREIHDNIGLALTLAKLNLNTLEWSTPDIAKHSVKSTIQLISSAITDLSDLSKSMNPDLIKNIGLIKALKIEVKKLIEIAHLSVEFEIQGEPIFMDSERELIIFRIIQEAFNNIIKHSKASNVSLLLNYNEHNLNIQIKDNGIGFDKEISMSDMPIKAGLNNMETRSKIFGGDFKLKSFPSNGTEILVTVPYI